MIVMKVMKVMIDSEQKVIISDKNRCFLFPMDLRKLLVMVFNYDMLSVNVRNTPIQPCWKFWYRGWLVLQLQTLDRCFKSTNGHYGGYKVINKSKWCV